MKAFAEEFIFLLFAKLREKRISESRSPDTDVSEFTPWMALKANWLEVAGDIGATVLLTIIAVITSMIKQ